MSVYDFKVQAIDGAEESLEKYRGKTLLIVNVASECGFTPQYTGLQKLQDQFASQGFSVLGFPCNQFGGQEPGSNEEIKNFCDINFRIKFPLYAKVDVNGPKASPLFEYLKNEEKGIFGTKAIKWNFTKFLVSKSGEVIKRYAPSAAPESLEADIKALL